MNGYLKAMRRYLNFRGRASRSEYWFYTIFAFLFGIVASVVDVMLFSSHYPGGPISTFFNSAHLVPGLAVGVRRLHDIDRTGWWLTAPFGTIVFAAVAGMIEALGADHSSGLLVVAGLAGLVGFVFGVTLLVFCCTRGTKGDNRFGAEPPETAAAVEAG